jgi:hypothetical protein
MDSPQNLEDTLAIAEALREVGVDIGEIRCAVGLTKLNPRGDDIITLPEEGCMLNVHHEEMLGLTTAQLINRSGKALHHWWLPPFTASELAKQFITGSGMVDLYSPYFESPFAEGDPRRRTWLREYEAACAERAAERGED